MKLPSPSASARERTQLEIEIGGATLAIDVHLLSVGEEADVLAYAHSYAKERSGVEEPSEADPLYVYGKMLATVARCAIDHDSPADKPERLFADERSVLAHPLITKEHVAYVFARYALFEDQKSPRKLVLGPAEYEEVRRESAAGNPIPFCKLRPGAQWSFVNITTRLVESMLEREPNTPPPAPETQ